MDDVLAEGLVVGHELDSQLARADASPAPAGVGGGDRRLASMEALEHAADAVPQAIGSKTPVLGQEEDGIPFELGDLEGLPGGVDEPIEELRDQENTFSFAVDAPHLMRSGLTPIVVPSSQPPGGPGPGPGGASSTSAGRGSP